MSSSNGNNNNDDNDDDTPASNSSSSRKLQTLAHKCTSLIASNLERYPAEAFNLLSSEEFNQIVLHRFNSTMPKHSWINYESSSKQKDDPFEELCQTGISNRLTPAISVKVMQQIEAACPHLIDEVTDEFIWKDIVNLTFRVGGPSRPLMLRLPWNKLVDQVKQLGVRLSESIDDIHPSSSCNNEASPEKTSNDTSTADVNSNKNNNSTIECIERVYEMLRQVPMSVSLLQESLIGKTLKKCIKSFKKLNNNGSNSDILTKLESLLKTWMIVAQTDGVLMKDRKQITAIGSDQNNDSIDNTTAIEQSDLEAVKECMSWRQLYFILEDRKKMKLSTYGKKMRQIRKDVDESRKNIEKVQVKKPSARQMKLEGIMKHKNDTVKKTTVSSSWSVSSKPSKMQMLRREATQGVRMQKGAGVPATKSKTSSMIFSDLRKSIVKTTKCSPSGPVKRSAAAVSPSISQSHNGEIKLGSGKKMKMPSTAAQRLNPVVYDRKNRILGASQKIAKQHSRR